MSEEYPEPRTRQRKGNYPYKFKIHKNQSYQTDWVLPYHFKSKWLDITEDGLITVKTGARGYAWDGCTPKVSVFNLWIVGTPDGHVDYRTSKPFTHDASLFHDALYQYLDTVPVSKKKIDLLFLEMLGDFKLAKLYYWGVRLGGGL